MKLWLVLVAIAAIGVIYIMIPVGLAARGYFRRYKLVRCPVVGLGAGIVVSRAGIAEALGCRSLRRVSDCTFWPRRRNCSQRCRLLADEEIIEYRQSGM
jgi:hypothetical protein